MIKSETKARQHNWLVLHIKYKMHGLNPMFEHIFLMKLFFNYLYSQLAILSCRFNELDMKICLWLSIFHFSLSGPTALRETSPHL